MPSADAVICSQGEANCQKHSSSSMEERRIFKNVHRTLKRFEEHIKNFVGNYLPMGRE
jgi:hypothetical protein